MTNNKTELTCESCCSPIMIIQDESGLHYECSYCGLSCDNELEYDYESL